MGPGPAPHTLPHPPPVKLTVQSPGTAPHFYANQVSRENGEEAGPHFLHGWVAGIYA